MGRSLAEGDPVLQADDANSFAQKSI